MDLHPLTAACWVPKETEGDGNKHISDVSFYNPFSDGDISPVKHVITFVDQN